MKKTLFDNAYPQKRTWLQKNIRPLIALIILGFVLICFGVVLDRILADKVSTTNKDVLLLLMNSLTAFVSLVLGFYFGSMEKNGEAASPSGDYDDPEIMDIPEICPHCGEPLSLHAK